MSRYIKHVVKPLQTTVVFSCFYVVSQGILRFLQLRAAGLDLRTHRLEFGGPMAGVSKNRGFPPKWMVDFMENPMNKWMIWGKKNLFLETPIWWNVGISLGTIKSELRTIQWTILALSQVICGWGKRSLKIRQGFAAGILHHVSWFSLPAFDDFLTSIMTILAMFCHHNPLRGLILSLGLLLFRTLQLPGQVTRYVKISWSLGNHVPSPETTQLAWHTCGVWVNEGCGWQEKTEEMHLYIALFPFFAVSEAASFLCSKRAHIWLVDLLHQIFMPKIG